MNNVENIIENEEELKPREKNKSNERLSKVTLAEKRFLDAAIYEATEAKKKKLTKEERRTVLCVARDQIRSQRKAKEMKRIRDEEHRAATTSFEWKRPTSFRR